MSEMSSGRDAGRFGLGPVGIPCTWCEAEVQMPAGDLIGVCLKCGAVVWRKKRDSERAIRYSEARHNIDIPTPA